MTANYIDVLRNGVADELNAAASFILLSKRVPSSELKMLFIEYAKEELSHAELLIKTATDLSSTECFIIPDMSTLETDDNMTFLVNYLAKEEAAVFYYETLARMTVDDSLKSVFLNIQKEEENHMHQLTKIVEEHAGELVGESCFE